MERKYTDEQLSKAILMILNEGMSSKEVAEKTGINLRAIQRYKAQFVGGPPEPEPVTTKEIAKSGKRIVQSSDAQEELDEVIIRRTHFLNDVFEGKKVVLDRIIKLAKKYNNIDALQRTLKTLADIEALALPKEGDVPAAHIEQINMFQFFNQKLTKEGYEGPALTDADIVNGD
jgi:transposase-like protein